MKKAKQGPEIKPTPTSTAKKVVENPIIALLKKENKSLLEENKAMRSSREEFEKTLSDRFLKTITRKTEEAEKLLQESRVAVQERLKSEYEEKSRFILERFSTELVEVVSELEKIISYPVTDPAVKNYLMGFQLFLRKFEELFSNFDISSFQPELNKPFDSGSMEALEVTERPGQDLCEGGIVKSVNTKGYLLNKRVIKLATVNVEINKKS